MGEIEVGTGVGMSRSRDLWGRIGCFGFGMGLRGWGRVRIGRDRTRFSVSLGKYEILEKCDFKRVFGGFW